MHAFWVEAVRRFIENQQLGVAEQCGGKAEALPHAHRISADPAPRRPGQAHFRLAPRRRGRREPSRAREHQQMVVTRAPG